MSDPDPGSLQPSSRLQMAGHEWEDWFEREEFIGQISDMRVQNLQGKSIPRSSCIAALRVVVCVRCAMAVRSGHKLCECFERLEKASDSCNSG